MKLASEWERRIDDSRRTPGSAARLADVERGLLPPEYARGLELVQWPGRSQVVHDDEVGAELGQPESRLSFYIDGAHTPESMETCAEWFADQATLPTGELSVKGRY